MSRPAQRVARRLAFAALVFGVAVGGSLAPQISQAQSGRLEPELRAQLQLLRQEKGARSPTERKVSSRLLHAERLRRGTLPPGLRTIQSGIETDASGSLLIDLEGQITPALLAELQRLGGQALVSLPARGALRARLPLGRVSALAARPEVKRLRPADRAFTRKVDHSEGDTAHYADVARSSLGIDGAGVSIGVLSDGVDSLASLQASGDLPSVTVLPGQGGSGTEGTAMLEILYDLAPGASLLFATAFSGQASFANNIVALRNAGADIIVDDVGYFNEAAFQDDLIAAAVDQVAADGALYFSAGGNSGNLDSGTSGVYEGDFVAGPDFQGHPAHDYGGGEILNEITEDSPSIYSLQWSDEQGASGNDYDLYLVDPTGTSVVAFSNDVQDGNDDPYENVSSQGNDEGRHLIVVKAAGTGRLIRLNAHRGVLGYGTSGQIWGHPTARGALAVAAVDARVSETGFDGTEIVEDFSSDGPRRIFFENDGTAITPGDFSSSGGELRNKPELTAADCVDTHTPGFNVFCGTSAAAPHAAAIAALLVERGGGPSLADPAEVVATLKSTAIDIDAAGDDLNTGAGIIHGEDAANAMPQCNSDPDCDDGLFCNGVETCVARACVAGAPPTCDGPTPFCDESLDACTECLSVADCDDTLYCNGSESCVAGACQAGTPPVCESPTPVCDDSSGSCAECLDAADCDDGLFCNGEESCVSGACQAGPPPDCQSPTPFCDEVQNVCGVCLTNAQCDDGLYCNGSETCDGLGACEAGNAPNCVSPTPFCDESADSCAECLAQGDCDDALFCTGVETCSAGTCQPDPGPVCEAPTPICDEGSASCMAAEIPALPKRASVLWFSALGLVLLGLGVGALRRHAGSGS